MTDDEQQQTVRNSFGEEMVVDDTVGNFFAAAVNNGRAVMMTQAKAASLVGPGSFEVCLSDRAIALFTLGCLVSRGGKSVIDPNPMRQRGIRSHVLADALGYDLAQLVEHVCPGYE